jgi:uncharacterized membrane protein (UPF0127 family)
MLININTNTFKVKPVFTEKDTSKGMMGKKFDSLFNGMLFMMGSGQHCFWMKNCIIPLDIIFIQNNTISKIHHNCPPCKFEDCVNYCGDGDLVLEIEGGVCEQLGITEGDIVDFI